MNEPDRRRLLTMAFVALALGAMAFAVARAGSFTPTPTDQTVVLTVLDEAGAPLANAGVTLSGESRSTNSLGEIALDLASPELVIIEASGSIPEPVVVMPDAGAITVRLLDRVGPGGDRVVMHFGGDFMLGRRYQDPSRSRTAVALTERDARDLMANLAPLFQAADLQVVNFESVLGLYDPDAAYPGKRYLIQTPTFAIEALRALGVDAVTLGNNHIYDWLDAGMEATLGEFDAVSMPYAGVGFTDGSRIPLAIVDAAGVKVAVLSYSSVSGNTVNEFFPDDRDVPPTSIAPDESWMWELREFHFGAPGDAVYVPPAARRPGSAYEMYVSMESALGESERAELWSSLSSVYPELQDWLARRGHGGALPAIGEHMMSDVAAARAAGAELVVVQIHGSSQLSDVPSAFHRDASRRAIDAGADLIVNHNPHVIQGFEWYDGKLIAHSLGNIVFDQDFLATLESMVLRTVFESGHLVEAKAFPVALIDYVPSPVGGDVADRVLRRITAAARSETVMDRTDSNIVVRYPDSDPGHRVGVRSVNGVGVVESTPQTGGPVAVDEGFHLLAEPALALVEPALSVEFGLDLLGWGDPSDHIADGVERGGVLWRADEGLRFDAEEGWVLSLTSSVSDPARPVLRIPIERHRIHTFEYRPVPLDPVPSYSVVLDVLAENNPRGVIQVSQFQFDDSNLAIDPIDEPLEIIEVPFEPSSEGWHTLEVRLPHLDPATTMVRLRILVEDSRRSPATLHLRDVQFIEWRDAGQLPPDWYPVDAFRASESTTVTVLAP